MIVQIDEKIQEVSGFMKQELCYMSSNRASKISEV